MREGASYPQSGQSYHRWTFAPSAAFADTNVLVRTLRTAEVRSGTLLELVTERRRVFRLVPRDHTG